MYLEDNDLSGEIVPELGDLTQLGELYLYFNADLSGEIPAELENTALRSLDISGTSVSGRIPPELGNLETLRDLELWNNPNMSGEIPPELGGLASLEVLRLINIGLTGSIPPDLGALPKLEWLVLPGNNLSGEIPKTWLALDLDEFGMYQNRGLCVPNTKAFDVWLDSMKNPLDRHRCEDG